MPPPDPFDQLYADHRDAVWRFLVRRTGDRHAAEDLTTEVFVVAWRRRGEVDDLALPWLLGVARGVLQNHRRGTARRHALAEAVQHTAFAARPWSALPEDAVERDALLAALAQLGERDRELVLLVAWEGLAVRDAARVLGLLPSTAGVRLHRARRKLRAALDLPAPTLIGEPA